MTEAEWEYEHYRHYGDRPATDSEAHVEWHWNAGVPMGTPGCPWDACHGEDDWPTESELAYDTRHVCGEECEEPCEARLEWEARERETRPDTGVRYVSEPSASDDDDLPF